MTPIERIRARLAELKDATYEHHEEILEDCDKLIEALECALSNMNNRSDDIATREDIADILEGKK